MQRLVFFSHLLVVMLMSEPVQASPAWAAQTLIRVSKACAGSHVDSPIAVQQDRNLLGIDVQQIKAFARSWCSNYAILYVYQKPSQCGDLLALLKVSKKIILMSHYDCQCLRRFFVAWRRSDLYWIWFYKQNVFRLKKGMRSASLRLSYTVLCAHYVNSRVGLPRLTKKNEKDRATTRAL
jgi:hypothetical protein